MSFNESQATYCGTGVDNFHTSYKNWHGYISLIVCTLGTGANILNIIVLTRKDMRSSTNAILTGLAVADLAVMLEYIPYTIHDYILIENLPREERLSYAWACFIKFHSIFTQVLHTISIWLTVTLAVWRFIAVAYPQKNRQWCNMQTTLITIITAYVVCILIVTPSLYLVTAIAEFYETLDRYGKTLTSIPVSQYIIDYQHTILNDTTMKMNIVTTQKNHQHVFKSTSNFNRTLEAAVYNNATIMPSTNSNTIDDNFMRNITVYRLYHSDLALRNKSIQHITFLIYSVLIKLIPCIALTILSVRLIMALLKAKRRRKKLTNNFTNTVKTMMANGGKMSSMSTASGSSSEPKTNTTTTTTTTTTAATAKATATALATTMAMKQRSHKQSNLMEKEKQTDRTTRMLLAVLLLFLITEFPQGIMGLLNLILGDAFLMECYLKFSDVMDILALINSSINFILYCSMSRQFRITFVLLFRPKFFDKWSLVAQDDDDTRTHGDGRWHDVDDDGMNYKLNDNMNTVNKKPNDNDKLLQKTFSLNSDLINRRLIGIGNQIATTTQATNV